MFSLRDLDYSRSDDQLDLFHNYEDIPVKDLIGARIAVLGTSGSGKTVTGARLAEQADDCGLCCLIFDVEGDYTTLRKFKSDRFRVFGRVFSEESEGMQERQVSTAIDRLLDDRKSVIIDLTAYSKHRQLEIILWCLKELYYRADKDRDKGVLVFYDECHEYFPQDSKPNVELMTFGTRVFKRGRKRQIGGVLLSQRPASVNKDLLTQCNFFIGHKVFFPNDIETYNMIFNLETGTKTGNRAELENAVLRFHKGEAFFSRPVFGDIGKLVHRVRVKMRESNHPSDTGGIEVLRK